ncbi:MAG: dienelactone hydrolase family protein [Clostridiales bacterium]|nr:dienelactone hydrolase family protein [Clostridiales bacterium]
MWNDIQTGEYEGMLAETVTVEGHGGDRVRAYFSRPLGGGPHKGIILIPHMPGWDEFCRETARRFTQHGYLALCPDIFCRFGSGTPCEVAARARAAGGVPDDCVMGDCEGALSYLASQPYSNGKVGVIGMCSGGRHAFLAACKVSGLSAAVDCWGGGVVAPKEELTPARPVAPIDLTPQLGCPLLGIFGNDDHSPTAEQVDLHEAELKKYGKDYAFHRYDGAGHGFWYYSGENYRHRQAMDSWEKVFSFLGERLEA